MRFGWISLLVVSLAAQSQPTFRSEVELLRLDVSVVGESGAPVRDLRPEDFVVKVDGKPRKVTFARFYGPQTTQAAPATIASSLVTDNSAGVRGRVVIFVVHLEGMTFGYEKLVLETAGSILDQLEPNDSVGLILIPGKGIDLTRDHARVRQALAQARGTASSATRDHALTVREAEAFAANNNRIINEVVERECPPADKLCPKDLDREARQFLVDADLHVRNLLTTLSDLNARIARIDAPRTVVVLSAGLPYRQESDAYVRELRRASAESGVTTYVVQLRQPETAASSRGRPGTDGLTSTDLAEGLSNVAGATDGTMHVALGRPVGVFDRIRSEIVHTYQLGVESLPGDADGKAHEVEVRVARPGTAVRARSGFAVPKERRAARTAAEAMSLPPGLAEAPLAVSAYTTRGEEPATPRLVVLLESLTGTRPAAAPSYAVAITSSDGRPVFQTRGDMKAHIDGAQVGVAAHVAPGRYWVRGAVVDENGRAGSVELSVVVGMRQAGDFQFSDLIVGTLAGGFTPSSRIHPPDATALLELYTGDPSLFEGVTVDLELIGGESVLSRGTASVSKTAVAERLIAQGTLHVPALEPGTYQVVAVVKRGGMPVARVARPVTRP